MLGGSAPRAVPDSAKGCRHMGHTGNDGFSRTHWSRQARQNTCLHGVAVVTAESTSRQMGHCKSETAGSFRPGGAAIRNKKCRSSK